MSQGIPEGYGLVDSTFQGLEGNSGYPRKIICTTHFTDYLLRFDTNTVRKCHHVWALNLEESELITIQPSFGGNREVRKEVGVSLDHASQSC